MLSWKKIGAAYAEEWESKQTNKQIWHSIMDSGGGDRTGSLLLKH